MTTLHAVHSKTKQKSNAGGFATYSKWAAKEGIYGNNHDRTEIDEMFHLLSEFMNSTEGEAKKHVQNTLEQRFPSFGGVSVRKYSLLLNRVLADELMAHITRDIGDFINVSKEVSFTVTYKRLRLKIQDLWTNNHYEYDGVMGSHTNYLHYDCMMNELKNRPNYKDSATLSLYHSDRKKSMAIYKVDDDTLKSLDSTLTDANISEHLRQAATLANTLIAFIKEQMMGAKTLLQIKNSVVEVHFKSDNYGDWQILSDSGQLFMQSGYEMRHCDHFTARRINICSEKGLV